MSIENTAYTSMYLSVHAEDSDEAYYTHPNETHHGHECDQSSFDTCIVRLDSYLRDEPTEITVFLSIYAFYDVNYQLWIMVDDLYQLDIHAAYRLDFSNYQSGLLKLDGKQFKDMEEVVMIMTYNTSGKVGQFRVLAAVDQVPNSQGCCDVMYEAKTVGAFNKVLKMPSIEVNQVYYVLIEGEK